MKPLPSIFAVVLLLCFAAPLWAQNGCINSPENPTALLALVGAAGGWVSYARARRGGRKSKNLRS